MRSVAVALLVIIVRAGVVDTSAQQSIDDARIESVRLSEIDSEGVQITIERTATARSTATLEYLVIDQPTIGSIRVNLPPIPGPIRLRAGEPIDGLPPLRVRVGYRELESLDALRRIVSEGRARGRDGNAALVSVAGATGMGIQLADATPPRDEWQPATIVRVRRIDGAIEPSFWQTSVKWDGSRYEIRHPVDRDAFGSPIWTDGGVVGIVQDELSGAAVADLLEKLGYAPTPRSKR